MYEINVQTSSNIKELNKEYQGFHFDLPFEGDSDVTFLDLFKLDEIQEIQDTFAKATGVASIITFLDGSPITKPSNFSRLCREIVCSKKQGNDKCKHFYSRAIGSIPNGQPVQRCSIVGLCNAGTSIHVGDKHIANWHIGQVRTGVETEEAMTNCARDLHVDEKEFRAAFAEVPIMTEEQLEELCKALHLICNNSSRMAFQNVHQAKRISKLTEAALKRSQNLLSEAQRLTHLGSWEMNLSEQRITWSDQVFHILGLRPQELQPSSQDVMARIHPDDRKRFLEQFREILKTGKFLSCDHRIVMQDGAIRWVHVTGMLDSERTPVSPVIVGTMQDITERKRVEEEQRESNKILLALSHLQSLYISDANPRILFKEVLNTILTLTGSEYGFVAEVTRFSDGRQYLKAQAITNIAWDKKTNEQYRKISKQDLEFSNQQSLYGAVLQTGEPVISNSPSEDPRSGGLPEGHPPIRSFLGLPVHSGGKLVSVVGLANRPGGYDEKLIEYLHPLLMSFGNIIGAHKNDFARRAAEKALSESEKRFRHIYEHSPVMIHSMDENGYLTSVNRKWLEETGYSREEVIGKKLDFLVTSESAKNALFLMSQLWSDGHIRNIPYQFTRKDGSIIDVLLDSNATTEPSGLRISLNAAKNVTESKRAVEQLQKSKTMLQMIFDGISEPLIMLGRDMNVSMINAAAKSYLGLSAYVIALGKPCFCGFMGRSSPCKGCDKPFSSLGDYTGSFERKSPLDPTRLERVVVYRVTHESTGEEATIIRISDITQCKLMERQLIQSEKLASLGLLISGIAHEMNNPNSFIAFNIPILKRYLEALIPIIDDFAKDHQDFAPFEMSYEEFRKDIFKLLENMEHGSNRIDATVSGLKEFVRKRENVEHHQVDVGQVVQRAVTLCGPEIKKRVRSFKVNVPKKIPPLLSDPEALEQVVVNLLINAAHAANEEDSWIRLDVVPHNEQLPGCVIEVSDNGHGMDETTKRKIFDPFFTTKAATNGTGLGLYLCQNLVEGLGGRIEVESEPDRGSTFRLIFQNGTSLKA